MTASPARTPFAVRDFRLLWAGEAVSALGDQFALIALPWLALVLTGDAFALGTVLALMAVPRALLMLVGGASVDRLSPRRVMLASNAVRLLAVTVLGGIVLAGAAELWMLYVFALAFGVADAFFFPAQTSIVPELVAPEQLQQANGIVQGTAQASILLGPALAGLVIAALGGAPGDARSVAGVGAGATVDAGTAGIAAAFLVDGVTFLLSIATLLLIRARPIAERQAVSIADDIRTGIAFVVRSPALRAVVLLSLTANLLIVGPFEVGLPVLAYSRLPEGAAAFGILMAAFGGGSLAGLALGATLPAPRPSRFALAVIGATGLAGAGLAFLPVVHSTLVGVLVIGISGVGLGYGNLLGITWTQSRIPPELMGRVMSVILLGSVGLVPVSMFVAGAAVQVSLDGMLLVAGSAMAFLAFGALLSPVVRNLGFEPAYRADGPEPADATEREAAAPASAA